MLLAALAYSMLAALLSCVSFVLYGLDKRRAVNGDRRVPERTLHWLALAGGWPGAIAGQRVFRHKTYKRSFRLWFWLVTVSNVLLVGAGAALAAGLIRF